MAWSLNAMAKSSVATLDERATVVGIGPITVDPAAQNQGVGRRLMQAVIDRAASRGVPSVRLCQATFHRRSLCLYTTMGFRTRRADVGRASAPDRW